MDHLVKAPDLDTNFSVRITIDLDWDTGDYDIEFRSLTDPGFNIDQAVMYEALKKILEDWNTKIDCKGSA